MDRRLLLFKLPVGVAVAASTKGIGFLGVPIALAYYFFTYKHILNSSQISDEDKQLYKKSPYIILIAFIGGVFDSMLLYGIAVLLYFIFILSFDYDEK